MQKSWTLNLSFGICSNIKTATSYQVFSLPRPALCSFFFFFFGFVPVSFGSISPSTRMNPEIPAHTLPSPCPPVSTNGRFKKKMVHSWIITSFLFNAFPLLAQHSLFFDSQCCYSADEVPCPIWYCLTVILKGWWEVCRHCVAAPNEGCTCGVSQPEAEGEYSAAARQAAVSFCGHH